MKGDTERELVGLRCPSCGRAFVWLGGRDINIGDDGLEEVECNVCGVIASLPLAP